MDPGDFSRVWFQDPATTPGTSWPGSTRRRWAGRSAGRPLAYARKLAAATHRFPDTRRALAELLDRWGAGLTANRAERRMALRLSEERLRLAGDDAAGSPQAAAAAAVAQVTAWQHDAGGSVAAEAVGGDDDEDDECDAPFPGEEGTGPADEDDFYADVGRRGERADCGRTRSRAMTGSTRRPGCGAGWSSSPARTGLGPSS